MHCQLVRIEILLAPSDHIAVGYIWYMICSCTVYIHAHTHAQAETATISIPELDFELHSGTLGGRFSTIEGILNNIKSQLKESNPFAVGDSASNSKLAVFLDKLTEVSEYINL